MVANHVRTILRGEFLRQEFFSDGLPPDVYREPPPYLRLCLEAAQLLRSGGKAEAAEKLVRAEAERPRLKGTCDGVVFDDFRDLDDLFAGFLEVVTNQVKYVWIAFEYVQSIEFTPPNRPRDLYWRRANMKMKDGSESELIYLPAIYLGSHKSKDDALRLGRATDWQAVDGGAVRGVGQRMFLAGEEPRSIMDVKKIEFA
jgi:type VI secretion system protein ImpE